MKQDKTNLINNNLNNASPNSNKPSSSKLNFQKLINEYKQDNFKKMAILHHEFVYACFHPTIDDCLIALEKNYYPNDSELFQLVEEEGSFYANLIKHLEGLKDIQKLKKLSQLLGIDRKLLTIITEEDIHLKIEGENILKKESSQPLTVFNQNANPSQLFSNQRDDAKNKLEIVEREFDSSRHLHSDAGFELQEEDSQVIDREIEDRESEDILTNQEMIYDAIKFELLKRIKANMNANASSNLKLGGKNLNQIISHGIAPGIGMKLKTDEQNIDTQFLNIKLEKKQKNSVTRIQTRVTGEKTLANNNEEAQQELQFNEPKSLREERMLGTSKKKYGISIWKLNRGQQAYQQKEHPFNSCPAMSKFFISHDSQKIVLFVKNESSIPEEETISAVKILDIKTLELIDEISTYELSCIEASSITDAALVWGDRYLFIQSDVVSYFFNIDKRQIEYFFENEQSDQNKSKVLLHSIFKDNEPLMYYTINLTNKQTPNGNVDSYQLFKTQIDKNKNIFERKNKFADITSGSGVLEYTGVIGYNKRLTSIVFPGEQVYYVYNVASRSLKSIRNVQNCQVKKNCFLDDFVWIAYNDDNYDTFTSSTYSLSKKYHLSNLDLDDFSLGDIQRERGQTPQDSIVMSIGKKGEKEASSRICVNIVMQDGQNPFVNYIQETSDFVFAYPVIMYCKGNSELFIQNLNQPEKLIKLDLEEQFVQFVDMNHYIKLKPLHIALGLSDGNQQFRAYESIAFLTQSDERIFLNILEYSPYSYDKQYTLYKSSQSIQRPKTQYGNIIKAVFQKVKHKECKDHDYILILQYRNQILIRSFFNLFVLNIEKYIYKFPMIYLPSKYKDHPDICFYMTKDGYSTKIERLGFNGKEHKDPLSTAYELKTQSVFVFCYHNKHIYVMDDTLTLKKFEYDRRTQKLKVLKMFEFCLEYRDFLAQPVDYHDIQVSDKGVYRGLLFVPFFEQNIFNKDIGLIRADPIFNVQENELFSGPKKLTGTQYMMYIARGDKNILSNDQGNNSFEAQLQNDSMENILSEVDEQIGQDTSHNIPKYSPAKSKNVAENDPDLDKTAEVKQNSNIMQNVNGLKKSKTLHRISNSVIPNDRASQIKLAAKGTKRSPSILRSPRSNLSPTGVKSQKTTDAFDFQNVAKSTRRRVDEDHDANTNYYSKSTFKTTQNALTFNNQNNNEQVYAWIVPFLDSNVLQFTHSIKKNSNPKYQVDFSTFINNYDQILIQMNKIFYLYSKNGTFLYQVNTIREGVKNAFTIQQKGLELESVSINMTYYSFYDHSNKCFDIYQLARDRVETHELKKNLTRQKYTRLKSKLYKSQGDQPDESIDRYIKPYIFQYVKSVKEYGNLRFKDDYFNQRHISNYGQLYQLIQIRRSAINSAIKTNIRMKFEGLAQINQAKKSLIAPNKQEADNEDSKFLTEYEIMFKFYIDDEEKSEDIKQKFSLVKDHLNSKLDALDERRIFGFQILGNYLFIKRNLRLEYLKIFETDLEHGTQQYKIAQNAKAKYIHLMLDKNSHISRLMSTSQQTPELLQIIVSDERFMYVITWEIEQNIEHQMMQLEKKFDFNAGHAVCKGITERHNYIPIDNSFYDLYFGLPFKFFENIGRKCPRKAKMNMNERKLSQANKEYLDLYENNKVLKSYSYLDLCYMKAFYNLNKDQIEQKHIMTKHLNIRIKGYTFFSFIALDFNLLKEVYDEVMKIDDLTTPQTLVDNNSISQYKMLFIHMLYPDFNNMSAFDIAMRDKSPKSIELMLEMLCQLGNFSLSKFFMHHFSELFQMELVSFQNFLSSCQFQLPRMREIKVLKWVHPEDEHYLDYHTSYLGDQFYQRIKKRNFGRVLNELNDDEFEESFREQTNQSLSSEQEINKIESDIAFKDLNVDTKNVNYGILGPQIDDFIKKDTKLENMQWKKQFEVGEYKRVETFAVEFDWIFRGKNAISFIEHLAHNANDSIFAVDTIRIIVLFLWERFFYNIRNKIFIPFVFYFVLFMVQIAFIYQQKVYIMAVHRGEIKSDTSYSQEELDAWRIADYSVISVLFLLWFYFFSIEVKQVFNLKLDYILDFWNWFDVFSLGLNMAYLVRDLTESDSHSNRILSSLAALLMWLKLLYFLRLFAPTAALIRMIVEIVKDMSVFTIIYFIAIIGFADAFYILAYNLNDNEENEMFKNNFFLAIIYSYRTGLGDFVTDAFDNSEDIALWYILFIFQTVFIQIVLLNLLIAIMGDTFDKVTEKREESKLKEICEMISDYEGIMDREKEFKYSKYIIVSKVEKAQANQSSDWEGKLATLKTNLNNVVSEVRKEQKQQSENLREEVIGNSKSMEQKFMDLQSILMKQSSQLGLTLKKIDHLKDIVKKVSKKTKRGGTVVQDIIAVAGPTINLEQQEGQINMGDQADFDDEDEDDIVFDKTPDGSIHNTRNQ